MTTDQRLAGLTVTELAHRYRVKPGKPSALPVHLDGIPAELRLLNQFGVWRFEDFVDEDTGEVCWDKISINARTGRRASSTNPQTWSSLAEAVRAL
jgi:hypothetical protein